MGSSSLSGQGGAGSAGAGQVSKAVSNAHHTQALCLMTFLPGILPSLPGTQRACCPLCTHQALQPCPWHPYWPNSSKCFRGKGGLHRTGLAAACQLLSPLSLPLQYLDRSSPPTLSPTSHPQQPTRGVVVHGIARLEQWCGLALAPDLEAPVPDRQQDVVKEGGALQGDNGADVCLVREEGRGSGGRIVRMASVCYDRVS